MILNRVYCADGVVRSLDGQDFLAQKHALGAVADRVLEEQLTAAGFEFDLRPDGMARELTVVPPEVAEQYSSRSRQITAKVGDLVKDAEERFGRELTDWELYQLKRQATLATRAAKKHVPETSEEMLDRWQAELRSEVGLSLDVVADAMTDHLQRPELDEQTAEWSPAGVVAEAVAACGEQRSAWRRADLMLEISRRLPTLGGLDPKATVELLDRLTDEALAGDLVQIVAGQDDLNDPADTGDLAELLARDPFTRPSARLYATSDTLAAESALRQAAVTRGRLALDRAAVAAWLDEHCATIGADQRAVVEGIASSDAALTVLVGPAGTGKSFTAGTFAHAWADLTAAHDEAGRGRVVGLATSKIATQVLRGDGIEDASTIDSWLHIQERLSDGSTHPAHTAWRLGPSDVVMVDEASMVTTAHLHDIQAHAETAGARVVLTGDPRQLGAVEAGGVLGLLDGHAETYTLTDVRRFTNDWERAASLDLRHGQPDAVAEYDRHGRLDAHPDSAAAFEAAARAAVADRLDGRSVVVVTGTNKEAASVASAVRARLVGLGLVQEDGVLLGRDGCTAGVGDVIACRENDYTIGVTNRVQYDVLAVHEDGSLTVRPLNPTDTEPDRQPTPLRLPAEYVAEDVQLGYASTAHAAQGLTVDAGHLVTDGNIDAPALYVGMTRGRTRNTAHVATTPDHPELHPALKDKTKRPSAVAVLEGALGRTDTNQAATVEAERDLDRLASMSLLAGRAEALTRLAVRERTERHLDDLVADGTLDLDVRARLCADQGTEHLSRLLRAVEQTGADPKDVLRNAVAGRPLNDADSVAQVLSHRITGGRPLDPDELDFTHGTAAAAPADVTPEFATHLDRLGDRIHDRRGELGARQATNPEPWALDAFGPVPTAEGARDAWQQRAGVVAGHREAAGWDDEHRAIGPMPGLAATERRASHIAAWQALGRPEDALTESAMTEGRLRVRVRAAQAAQAWAPPHADDALRAAELAAEEHRLSASLLAAEADAADRAGTTEHADQLRQQIHAHTQEATLRGAAAERLTALADARSKWAAREAVTMDIGDRAQRELHARGLDVGQEPDRTTAEEWLALDHAARQTDDEHRAITETDIAAHSAETDGLDLRLDDEWAAAAQDDASADAAESLRAAAARQRIPTQATSAELDLAMSAASLALRRAEDQASAEASHSDPEQDEVHAGTAYDDERKRREAMDLDAATAEQASTTQHDHSAADDA